MKKKKIKKDFVRKEINYWLDYDSPYTEFLPARFREWSPNPNLVRVSQLIIYHCRVLQPITQRDKAKYFKTSTVRSCMFTLSMKTQGKDHQSRIPGAGIEAFQGKTVWLLSRILKSSTMLQT